MKENSPQKGIVALNEYLEKFDFQILLENEEFRTYLPPLYKRYHALLTWHAHLSSKNSSLVKLPNSELFESYFSETVSDICQSIFLWIQGLYKPHSLVLRSAVENFVKCIGLFCGNNDIVEKKNVFEIFDLVKDVDFIKEPLLSARFDFLRTQYSELCGYVHTAEKEKMSLQSYFKYFPFFDAKLSKDSSLRIQKIVVVLCIFLCFMFKDQLSQMHHSNSDAIKDILPKDSTVRLKFKGQS